MTAAEPILASSLWTPPLTGSSPPTGRLPSTCKTIDAALFGGLDYGSITCISAEPDAGARDLTQSLIVSHLKRSKDAVVTVIDTGQALDVRRLYHAIMIASSGGDESSKKASTKATLDRVKLMKTFDFEGLTEGLKELRDTMEGKADLLDRPPRGTMPDSQADEDEMLDSPTPLPPHNTKVAATPAPSSRSTGNLLIVDNITQLAAPLLKTSYASGQALMTSFMRSLAHLTKAHNLCTLMTNGTIITRGQNRQEESPSAFSSCTVRPALGETWTHLVDVHLLVHQMPKTGNDATVFYGGQGGDGDGDGELTSVLEVVQDRCDGRFGRWAAFDVDGDGRLRNVL